MAKTDKELTAEIVCSFLSAWSVANNCKPPQTNEMPNLINSIYKTISSLGVNSNDDL